MLFDDTLSTLYMLQIMKDEKNVNRYASGKYLEGDNKELGLLNHSAGVVLKAWVVLLQVWACVIGWEPVNTVENFGVSKQ